MKKLLFTQMFWKLLPFKIKHWSQWDRLVLLFVWVISLYNMRWIWKCIQKICCISQCWLFISKLWNSENFTNSLLFTSLILSVTIKSHKALRIQHITVFVGICLFIISEWTPMSSGLLWFLWIEFKVTGPPPNDSPLALYGHASCKIP